MLKIALTGGIGSGKSTAAGLLAELGALVIDADAISRELVAPGQPALLEIQHRFGDAVLTADGSLDRAALADIVFTDETALTDLNEILHPRVAAESLRRVEQAPEDAVVVYDVPLLVEKAGTEGYDAVIVVEADLESRLRRLEQARGMTRADAESRMAAQATDEQRRVVADFIIDNSGDLSQLEGQTSRVWQRLGSL